MIAFLQRIDRRPSLLFALGGILLVCAVLLLAFHVRAMQYVREEGLPIASRMPTLERRLTLLQAQMEVAEVQSALRTGSQEEALSRFVLPEEEDMSRALGLLEYLKNTWRRSDAKASLSAISIGSPQAHTPILGITAHPLSFTLELSREAFFDFLSLVELSGFLTVGDALTKEERHLLFTLTEEENPSGLLAFERFLVTPLLDYAIDAKAAERALLQSFSSPAFHQSFSSILSSSRVRASEKALSGGLGASLLVEELSPLRFLGIDSLTVEQKGDRLRAQVTLHAYSRGE